LAFEKLNNALPTTTTGLWEHEIQEAEKSRPNNPASMDIMHSRIKCGDSLKSITHQITQREEMSKNSSKEEGTTTKWLLDGLQIEDEQ
jgi:hypothetical protein